MYGDLNIPLAFFWIFWSANFLLYRTQCQINVICDLLWCWIWSNGVCGSAAKTGMLNSSLFHCFVLVIEFRKTKHNRIIYQNDICFANFKCAASPFLTSENLFISDEVYKHTYNVHEIPQLTHYFAPAPLQAEISFQTRTILLLIIMKLRKTLHKFVYAIDVCDYYTQALCFEVSKYYCARWWRKKFIWRQ